MAGSTGRHKGGWLGITALWLITVLDAAMLGGAGWAKLGPGSTVWRGMFEAWGYPAGFSYVIGVAELALAIVLLVPRLASYAALGLIVIMIGALGTVLLKPGTLGPLPPLMHIVILGVIVVARWRARSWPGTVPDRGA